ncbi:MAG TPA: Calx-beta domain-containing protein [Thermoanaerobaculia bacterium]|jgi:hypothetical protein|nr:Calx-beta domain-containing protein [Thermoanaerobaculia bacterium]
MNHGKCFAATFTFLLASFAAVASAQTCPVHPNLEIRISGTHCQFPAAPNAAWSPCGLSSPVTLTIYDHDTGLPYQLQSCETGVNWIYQNETSFNHYVASTFSNQGPSIQVSSAYVGNSWAQAAVMSGSTQTQSTNTYIPFANGVITTSAPVTTVTEGGTAYVNVHTTYSPTSFRYTVTNDTNAAGRFTPVVTPLVVSFANGEYDKTIAIPTIDDSTAQGSGRIAVQVGDNNYDNGVEMAQMGNTFGGYISISDNDDPVFKWAQNSYTFAENASNPAVTVTRTGDPNTTASVDYLIGPSANSPAASGTLTFNTGETSKLIPVPIVNDNTWSADRHWIAELKNPSANTYLGSFSSPQSVLDVPITIVDDDSVGTLSINDVAANEGNTGHTNATLNITLSAAAASPFDISLTYGGTATPGIDYATPPASVHFDAGQTTVPLVITVISDTLVERDETVTVTLSHVTGSGGTPGIGKATGTLTILNDDVSMPGLKLAAGTTGHMTIYLGNPTTTEGTVTLASSKPDVATAAASFVAESGRSTLGFDVQALSPGESTITAKLPASLGGMTLSALVVVSSDQAPVGVAVTEVGPPMVPATGGTLVTITGLNFAPSCVVTFGETPAADVTFLSTSALKVTTPPHPAGASDVTVTCDDDQFTLTNGFAFFTPPTRSRGVRH